MGYRAMVVLVAVMGWSAAEEVAPVSPFAPNVQAPPRADARPGVATMSDGSTVSGLVMFTRGRKLEVFEDARQKWHAFDLKDLSRIDTEIEKELQEREWRFKEGGNDEKVYTGRVFIDRKYRMRLTLADGKTQVTGHVRGTVIYVQPEGQEPQRFFLQHDSRGSFGGEAGGMVYLKSLELRAVAPAPATPAQNDEATPSKP